MFLWVGANLDAAEGPVRAVAGGIGGRDVEPVPVSRRQGAGAGLPIPCKGVDSCSQGAETPYQNRARLAGAANIDRDRGPFIGREAPSVLTGVRIERTVGAAQ